LVFTFAFFEVFSSSPWPVVQRTPLGIYCDTQTLLRRLSIP